MKFLPKLIWVAPVMATGITAPALSKNSLTQTNIIEENIVVTATREAQSKQDLAESVGLLSKKALENIGTSHPSEALNRIAGVHINNLGGEGHMSSIRQPITTSAVYLFLEDGLPIRPTGFFNHNALYEINIPQANRLEVVKGPGSALYGSGAIGGVINVLTTPAPEKTLLKTNLEWGQDHWQRLLVSLGEQVTSQHSAKLDVNLTSNQGYRDAADYSRHSANMRIDSDFSDHIEAKTLLSFSDISQSGTSDLSAKQYQSRSAFNAYHGDIGYRDVSAWRLSSDISWYIGDSVLVSAMPYYRNNKMQMMPSWMISYDPNIRDYQFESYGLMLKYRQYFEAGRLIVGIDTDITPSDYREDKISLQQTDGVYLDYQKTGDKHYDFSATQSTYSPYIHTEWELGDNWRLNTGLRYDAFEVDYTDHLAGHVQSDSHLRPQSQSKSYQHVSPKLSLLYQYDADHTTYLNYRNAFAAPSVGSLFRPGSSLGSTGLKPTEADSFEIGLRGQFNNQWLYELAIYDLQKSNDVVSVISGHDRIVTNAGESRHLGLEAAVQGKLSAQWSMAASIALTNQYYQDFAYLYQCYSPDCGGFIKENRNYAGFKVGKAPGELANLTLSYQPGWLPNFSSEIEIEHLGKYFTDETNTQTYAGHTLVHLRNHYQINQNWQVYLRIINLTDNVYSVYTSNRVGQSDLSYRPGQPRRVYVGAKWQL